MKVKEIVKPIGALTIGGTSLTMGTHMIESMPVTPATAGVTSGMTRFSGFFPMMATGSAMGITMGQLGKIKKKFK